MEQTKGSPGQAHLGKLTAAPPAQAVEMGHEVHIPGVGNAGEKQEDLVCCDAEGVTACP